MESTFRWMGHSMRMIGVGMCILVLSMGLLPSAASAQIGLKIGRSFVLTADNQLLRLSVNVIESSVNITNLKPGEQVLGIDFRPATGRMYGLGSTSQLYVIDHLSGVASPVGGPFSTTLSGSDFGFDFNPVVDRIRVVSNTGQNLRIHPDTGAVAAVDGQLAFAAGDPNAGAVATVVAAAYSNPDTNPDTGTVLYDIDTALNVLTRQDPPNDGTLNTVGPLSVDATQVAGFDIGPENGGLLGQGSKLEALAVLQTNGTNRSRLHSIDLETGRAQPRGQIPIFEPLVGFAINIDLVRP